MGNIYDLVEEFVMRWVRHTDDVEENGIFHDMEFWSRMGFIAGAVFQDLFEEPQNYFEFDIDAYEEGDYEREE